MGRKKKIQTIQQTHGKLEDFKPSTLDQIWGDTGLSKYGTLNLEEYKKQIAEMNRTDLYRHCTSIGMMPIDNRELLEKKLIAEFQFYVNQYKMPNVPPLPPKEISEQAKKILAEGR